MGRRIKTGADYFPVETAIFNDRKIMLLKNKLGYGAVTVYLAFLCEIYGRDGYYLIFNEEDAPVMAERIGGKCDAGFIMDVVLCCLEKGLFDEQKFSEFGVLTSKGIQERFFKICSKRDFIEIVLTKRKCWKTK